MSETVGVAKVVLEGDTAGFEASVNKARESVKGVARETKKVGEEGTKAFNESTKAAERFAASVKRQADAIGKTKSQLMEAKAAALGLGNSLDPYIRKLREAEQAQTQLNSATASFAKASAAAFAAVSVTALVAGIKQAIDAADGLNDLSQKLGISVKSLAEFKLAAEQSGTSLESIARGSKALGKAMAENSAAFKQAGISTKDVKSAMYDLADLFAGMEDGVEKTQLAVKLFGKAGMDMIPMLNLGKKGLEDAAKAAENYANVMERIAPAADEFNDRAAELKVEALAGFATIAETLLPTMTSLVELMTEGAKETGAFSIAGEALKTTLQTVSVLAVELKYVFTNIGDEIGVIGAKAAAISRLDFAALKVLSDTFDPIGAEKLAEQQRLIERIMNPPALKARDTKIIDPEAAKKAQEFADRIKEAGKEAEKAENEFKKLNASIAEKISLIKAELSGDTKLTEAQKIAIKLNNDILNGTIKLTDKQKEELALGIERLYEQEQLSIAEKQRIKNLEEVQKQEAANLKTMMSATDTLQEKVKQARLENEQIGLTQEQLDALVLSRQDDAIAIKEQELATARKNSTGAAEIELIEEQLSAMKELRDLTASTQIKTAAKKAAEDATKAWEKFSDDVEKSLTDALMRGFEAGDKFGEAFVKTLQNTLKTAVLKIAVQGVMSQVTGQGGLLQQGASALGLMGQTGTATQGASAIGRMYDAYSAGSGLMGIAGQGLYGTAYGSFATSGIGTALGLSSPASLMGPTLTGEALGGLTSLGTALPYVGAALAVVSLLSGLGKGGTPHAGGIAFGTSTGYTSPDTKQGIQDVLYGTPVSGSYLPTTQTNMLETDWLKRENKEVSKSLGTFAQSLSATLNKITQQYGSGSGYSVGVAYSADGEDGSRGRFGVIKNGTILAGSRQRYDDDMQKGMTEFLSDVPSELVEALRGIDLSPFVDAYLDKSKTASADLLEGMADDQANAIISALSNAWLDPFLAQLDTAGMSFEDITAEIMKFAEVATLKPIFDVLSLDIYTLGQNISDALGGAQNAGAALSSYYQNFYTEAQRTEIVVEQLQDAFAELNVAVPDSREDFRALVESLDLTTDAGVQMYASLMQIAPIFAQVNESTQALAASTSEYESLMRKLYTLQGDGTALREMELDGISDANRGLQQYIWSLEDAAAAADAAALANEKAIEDARIFSEIATQTVRDMVELAQQSSTANANAAYDDLSKSIGREIDAINERRRASLAALDIQSKQWADTVAEADAAANKLRDTIDDLANSLEDAIDQLRGSVTSPEQNVAQGRAQLDKMLEDAFRGSVPDANDLAKALDAVTSDTTAGYSTRVEYQRAQAVQAGKLDTLASLIKKQAPVESEAVRLARQQLTSVDAQRAAIDAAADAQIAALDQQLNYAKDQLDATLGISRKMLTITDALKELAQALGKVVQTGTPEDDVYHSAAGATYNKTTDIWTDISGTKMTTPELKSLVYATATKYGERALYDGAKAAGISLADLEGIAGVPSGSFIAWAIENKLPVFSAGSNYLPTDMVAQVHEGERIIPAADNRALMDALDSNNVIDLLPLLEEVRMLKQTMQAVAFSTSKSARLIERVMPDGDAIQTREAA